MTGLIKKPNDRLATVTGAGLWRQTTYMKKTRKTGGGRKKLPKSEKIQQIRVSAKTKHIKEKGGLKEAQKTLQLFWNEQFNID